jgi:hypothetical protein
MNRKELEVTLNLPHSAQETVLKNSKRFNVLCCGRRWGKSALAVNLLSEPALEGHPVGYFTPTYKLLDGTYTEVVNALSPLIKRKHEHQFIDLITGGRIEFWSLDNEMSGRSKKYKRAIVDEAAFVKNLWKSWTESIRATLTDLKGDAWFLSTPRGKNDFFTLFSRGKAEHPNWASFQMPTYTNPYIDASEIDDAKADLPELAFSQEYMAEFNDDVANPFGFQFIQQCTYLLSSQPAICYGIDLAKSSDWTVIIGLDRNGCVCYFDRFQRSWIDTKREIALIPKLPMQIDSTGVGDPIVEDIRLTQPQAEGFKFNQTSKQQLMEGLALAIQQRKISFPEGHIKTELENFEYEFTRTGVRYSAPSGLHDDCVCALALAWHCYKTASFNGSISWI